MVKQFNEEKQKVSDPNEKEIKLTAIRDTCQGEIGLVPLGRWLGFTSMASARCLYGLARLNFEWGKQLLSTVFRSARNTAQTISHSSLQTYSNKQQLINCKKQLALWSFILCVVVCFGRQCLPQGLYQSNAKKTYSYDLGCFSLRRPVVLTGLLWPNTWSFLSGEQL